MEISRDFLHCCADTHHFMSFVRGISPLQRSLHQWTFDYNQTGQRGRRILFIFRSVRVEMLWWFTSAGVWRVELWIVSHLALLLSAYSGICLLLIERNHCHGGFRQNFQQTTQSDKRKGKELRTNLFHLLFCWFKHWTCDDNTSFDYGLLGLSSAILQVSKTLRFRLSSAKSVLLARHILLFFIKPDNKQS